MTKSFLVLACVVFLGGSFSQGMGMKEGGDLKKQIQDLKVPDTFTTESINEYLQPLREWPYKFDESIHIETANLIAKKFNDLIEGVKGTNFEAMVIADYPTISSIDAWNRQLDEIISKDSSKKKDIEEAKKLLYQNPIVKLLVMQWGVKDIDYLDRTKEKLKDDFDLAFNAVKLYEELVKDNNYKKLLCTIHHQNCLIPGLFKIIFNLPYTNMKTWVEENKISKENFESYKKTLFKCIQLYIKSNYPENKTIYEKTSALCSAVLSRFYSFFVFQQRSGEKLEKLPEFLSGNYFKNYKTAKAELFSDLKKIFEKNEGLVQLLEVLNIRLKRQEELEDDVKNQDNEFKDYATLLKILEKRREGEDTFLRDLVVGYIKENIEHIIKTYEKSNPKQKILFQRLIKKCHDYMDDNWFVDVIKKQSKDDTSILDKIILTEKSILDVFDYLSLDPLSKENIEEYLLECYDSLMSIERIKFRPKDEFYRDYFILLNTALTNVLTKIKKDDSLEKFLFFESRLTEIMFGSIQIIKWLNFFSQEVKKELEKMVTKMFEESMRQMTLYAESSNNNLYKACAIVKSIFYEKPMQGMQGPLQMNKNNAKKLSDLSSLLKVIIDDGKMEEFENILSPNSHRFRRLIEQFFRLFVDAFNKKLVEEEDINRWFYIYSKYIETITDEHKKIDKIMQMYEYIGHNRLYEKFKTTFTMYGLPLYFDLKMLFKNSGKECPEINFYIKLSNMLTEDRFKNLDKNVSSYIKILFKSKDNLIDTYLNFYKKACTQNLEHYKKILETLAKKITTWIIPNDEINEYKKSFLSSSYYLKDEKEKYEKLVEDLFGGREELLKETFDEFPAIPEYIRFSWQLKSICIKDSNKIQAIPEYIRYYWQLRSICTKDSSMIQKELDELSKEAVQSDIDMIKIDPLIQKYALSPDVIWVQYLEGNNNVKKTDFKDIFKKGYDVFTHVIDKIASTELIKEAELNELIYLTLKWYPVHDALKMKKLNPMEYLKKIVDIPNKKNQINAIVNIMVIAEDEIFGRNGINQKFLTTFKNTFVQLNKDLDVPIDIVFASYLNMVRLWNFEENLMQGLMSQKEFDNMLSETLLSLNAIKNINDPDISNALKDSKQFNFNIGNLLGVLYTFEAFDIDSFPERSLKIKNRLQDIKDCINLYKNETLCEMLKKGDIQIHCQALENTKNDEERERIQKVKDEFLALFTVDPLQQALMLLKAKLLHLAQTLKEK